MVNIRKIIFQEYRNNYAYCQVHGIRQVYCYLWWLCDASWTWMVGPWIIKFCHDTAEFRKDRIKLDIYQRTLKATLPWTWTLSQLYPLTEPSDMLVNLLKMISKGFKYSWTCHCHKPCTSRQCRHLTVMHLLTPSIKFLNGAVKPLLIQNNMRQISKSLFIWRAHVANAQHVHV